MVNGVMRYASDAKQKPFPNRPVPTATLDATVCVWCTWTRTPNELSSSMSTVRLAIVLAGPRRTRPSSWNSGARLNPATVDEECRRHRE